MDTVVDDVIAGVLLLALTAYSTAGGVDFGAGIWDLLAGNGRRGRQARALIDHAMAPVWEVNNVWLVLALVICWTGFPRLFESAFASLYPLLGLALVGLVLRGAFFAFRHIAEEGRAHRIADMVFGISSVLTPFFFAATLGAIASGRVTLGEPHLPVWEVCISPMSISFGMVSLAATAFSGASFLVGDARRYGATEMVEYFRRRAVLAALALIVIGTVALATIGLEAQHLLIAMFTGLATPFTLLVIVLTPVVALLHWRGIFAWFRVLTAAAVGSLVLAWGIAQSPYMLPGQLTIAEAASPTSTQVLLLVVGAGVLLVIGPALALLYQLDQRNSLESPEA
jgi:cytochrome d ubiquinol oxidase subunit II